MATAEGFVRRLTRRLTESPEQRDAEELTDEALNTGAQHAIDCCRGQEVTMVGRLRSVETNAKGCASGVRAEFFDGTDTVTLVWLGQRRIPGIEQVVMTTNGHLLAELAEALAGQGLSAVNVSIDTLDPDQFATLTSRGDLARVLAGIDAAVAAGLAVKTNAVALRGVNDTELVALCEDAWARGATPRFIEHMPMSEGQLYTPDAELSSREIRAALEQALGPLVARERPGADPGPARYWMVPGTGREVGIISAMTDHFCDDCNRLRLTATGALHACLGHDDAVSLREVVRAGGTDQDLVRAISAAVTGKRAGHVFERSGAGAPAKHMIAIGG